MPEVNFNLLAPTAELYSGPQVQMDPVAAYEKAKATRQSNMLAQLYAKHYDPQTGGVNYNALIPEAAQSGLDVTAIMPDVQKQQLSQAQQQHYINLAAQEKAAANLHDVEAKQKEAAARHEDINRAIRDVSAYTNKPAAMQGIEQKFEEGKIDQEAYDNLMNMVRSEPLWARSQSKILQSLLSEKEQLEAMQSKTNIGKLQSDYEAAVQRGDKVAAAKIKQAIDVEAGGMTEYQKQQLALERQREERLAKAATGGGKTTVSQEQANYNVNRLLNAANQITSAMTAEEGVQKPGLKETVVKGTFPSLAGAVQSGQRQIVDAAQTDMLDALLYLSTGAAYNKEQLEGQKKSYLPSFLDKPETVAAKQQRLITLIQDAKTRAGNAWTPDMDKKMDLILSSFKAAGAQPAAGGSNIPTVTTQKQYDALPKGAQFYEDGKLYRKP